METRKGCQEGLKIPKDQLGSQVSPFQTAKEVLSDFVHLERILPDEGDVQGALQTQLPQFLAVGIGVEAPMTKKKPNCGCVKQCKGGFLGLDLHVTCC